MQFKEDFLHFIWKFRLYNNCRLHCEPLGELQIISPGLLNKNAGPDFLEAKLKIDDTIWVGNVEIHLKSSDWLVHHHQQDPAYDNVILHVVYENDQRIYRKNGSEIPAFTLKGKFDETLWHNYNDLITATNHFPCEKHLRGVDSIIVNGFLSRQLVERLELKTAAIHQQLENYKGDWEKTFHYFLSKSFGFKVNGLPFELMASTLEFYVLKKYQGNPKQMEALIFGQAGFLNNDFEEPYPQSLRKEYIFLKHKHQLLPIDVSLWKFLRMRPQNFPTVRLAQYAALLIRHPNLFSRLLEINTFSDYYSLFQQLPIHQYWEDHYHFNKKTRKVILQIGKSSIENILINTICLFLYVYGKYTDQERYVDKAFDLLSFLPPEKNAIVEKYKLAGIHLDSAFLSQAVLQLNKNYCSQKKCLNCNIGIKILKK
ncbi:hypothetical protein AAKU52_003037 [Pedobacter sp. CG_S7]|uniref:DUF2851 family protein n=1 Tax=Pedobacter sp. CG_S7 TaxID=3143930 RepID=UPI0033919E5E